MNCIFQRIVQNDFQWTRPSPGRLGPQGEGEYLQKNGFGHEDWNFNINLSIKGNIYGYVYYNPAEKKKNETFNIAFATFTNGSWYVAGFYMNSSFIDVAPISEDIVKQKKFDILQLGKSLGTKWQKSNNAEILKELTRSNQYIHWKVKATDVIRLPQPVEIPKSVFNTKNYRIVRPTELSNKEFNSIFNYAINQSNKQDLAVEQDFPEGKEKERLHKYKERNPALIAIAKRNFIKKHGKLVCEICNFDFEKTYGEIGNNFIEAHHSVPISNLKKESKTKLSDIIMVCSNCHRMLHRRRPWLDKKNLKKILSLNLKIG